jgi:preprotein translocase subunit SecG
MYTLITILIAVACLLLIGVILIQESKGGGLASGFSSSNQFMGVRKTADILEKATWTLGISLVVLSLLATAVQGGIEKDDRKESQLKGVISPITPPAGMQAGPAPEGTTEGEGQPLE